MAWTSTTVNVKDGNGTVRPVIAYTDGTNFSFAHSLLDTSGNIVSTTPVRYTGGTTTRPNNTTAYVFGQIVANSTTAGSVVAATVQATRNTNQAFTLIRAGLMKSGTVLTNAIFRLHLFNGAITFANGDGAAFTSGTTGSGIYVGSFDITIDKQFSDVSMGYGVPTAGSCIANTPVSGQNYLNYVLEARAAYTPIANEVFTPYLEVQ